MKSAIQEFSVLEGLDLPESMVRGTVEVQEHMDAFKTNYTRMEHLNEILKEKLILVDRTSLVDDLEKSLADLS